MNWTRRNAEPEGLGERAGGQRLADARHVLQQHVAAGEDAGEDEPQRVLLADDGLADAAPARRRRRHRAVSRRAVVGGARHSCSIAATVRRTASPGRRADDDLGQEAERLVAEQRVRPPRGPRSARRRGGGAGGGSPGRTGAAAPADGRRRRPRCRGAATSRSSRCGGRRRPCSVSGGDGRRPRRFGDVRQSADGAPPCTTRADDRRAARTYSTRGVHPAATMTSMTTAAATSGDRRRRCTRVRAGFTRALPRSRPGSPAGTDGDRPVGVVEGVVRVRAPCGTARAGRRRRRAGRAGRRAPGRPARPGSPTGPAPRRPRRPPPRAGPSTPRRPRPPVPMPAPLSDSVDRVDDVVRRHRVLHVAGRGRAARARCALRAQHGAPDQHQHDAAEDEHGGLGHDGQGAVARAARPAAARSPWAGRLAGVGRVRVVPRGVTCQPPAALLGERHAPTGGDDRDQHDGEDGQPDRHHGARPASRAHPRRRHGPTIPNGLHGGRSRAPVACVPWSSGATSCARSGAR